MACRFFQFKSKYRSSTLYSSYFQHSLKQNLRQTRHRSWLARTLDTQTQYEQQKKSQKAVEAALVAAVIVGAALATGIVRNDEAMPEDDTSTLKEYTLEEIEKHNSLQSLWVIYKGKVYDVTEFAPDHPGGQARLLKAAGGDLEPWWRIYPQHEKANAPAILEEYLIGKISDHDVEMLKSKLQADPYANEPMLDPAIYTIVAEKPLNAETKYDVLADNYITPAECFYVRNHMPTPTIDPEQFVLEISGPGINEPLRLTLEDLKTKFKRHEITATIQCAGNRRSAQNKLKEVRGLTWDEGAIGNAKWAGAPLRDVLKYAGVDVDELFANNGSDKIRHVQFEALDFDPAGTSYGASIPIEKAVSPIGDCILAYEMNGEPVPRSHGAPLRAVVPGIVGARNVKWVNKIILSDRESDSLWQQRDYKGFNSSVDWDTVKWDTAPAIQELPVVSGILKPKKNESLQPGKTIAGYAYVGGGRDIIRVDVSVDGGKTWHMAQLDRMHEYKKGRTWAWSLWHLPIDENIKLTPDENGTVEVICKAVDSEYNNQPENVGPLWNLRGVLNNSWSRVKMKVT